MNFDLEIDELILHGFPAHQRHRIGDAVEAHLTLLLETRGLPHRASAQQPINIAPNASPESIGRQIATSIHQSLGGRAR